LDTQHQAAPNSNIVMSGMRPTGRLHLGHYLGVLHNWTLLQSKHTCFFSIVDWHALTTRYQDTVQLKEYVLDIALDWFAAGIDPKQSTVFIQSQIPEIAELHLLLSMVTPNKWVETDPTLKDMVAMLREGLGKSEKEGSTRDISEGGELTYGLLGYPVLQTSDILSVRGGLVPVGKDQVAHLEISRDIARRFNHVVGVPFFPEPRPLLTEVPLLKGLDGRKMGKSYNNAIFLSDTEDETWKKVKTAVTDPKRVKRTDEGSPENCVAVFPWYETLASKEVQTVVAEECRAGTRGCMDCKKQLAELLNEQLRPLREKRIAMEASRPEVYGWLKEGADKAREVCSATVSEAKKLLNLSYS
jgi:tryptophanyl-tRNA synthetase